MTPSYMQYVNELPGLERLVSLQQKEFLGFQTCFSMPFG